MAEEDLLAKLFEQLLNAEEKKDSPEEAPCEEEKSDDIFGGIDLEAILKLGEVFSAMQKNDKNTQLLLALKPHLRAENQEKVDGAMKMMKIMNILPLLKDSGILGGLF